MCRHHTQVTEVSASDKHKHIITQTNECVVTTHRLRKCLRQINKHIITQTKECVVTSHRLRKCLRQINTNISSLRQKSVSSPHTGYGSVCVRKTQTYHHSDKRVCHHLTQVTEVSASDKHKHIITQTKECVVTTHRLRKCLRQINTNISSLRQTSVSSPHTGYGSVCVR